MGKKLYVGNLNYDVTDAALEALFACARIRPVSAGHHGPHGPLQGIRLC